MTDTVKNNIIFNNEFNEEKYNEIVSVCELENDFLEFSNGDKTEINSTSANVSGGQKARISLARCLYKDADLYLLDDPLASVDSKVGNKIFKKAFNKYLKNKARVLVTNELNNLSTVNKIIYMEQGRIIFTGSFNDFNKKYGVKDIEVDSDDDSKFDEQTNKIRKFIRKSSFHQNLKEYECNKINDE
jgi:ATP-binding cassette subfamily C (CFTR/MRP) protein 4